MIEFKSSSTRTLTLLISLLPRTRREISLMTSVKRDISRAGRLTLVMRLISRQVLANRDIRRVNVPVLALLNSIMLPISCDGNDHEMKVIMYQLRNKLGNGQVL
ncbi:hypothetical protein V5N11_035339 [Cardamine amara subsp. amara]|uniref:Uncharacterized protein n=1 Tax=Cardamine amara subsp. amara TaxID=228776 RepID=A0ABD1B0M6_CARAN